MYMWRDGSISLRRFFVYISLVPVGCRGVGRAFGFRRLFRGTHPAGAVVTLFFHVVVLGQGRDQGSAAGQLAYPVQDNYGAIVVECDQETNLDDLPGEAADVAYI